MHRLIKVAHPEQDEFIWTEICNELDTQPLDYILDDDNKLIIFEGEFPILLELNPDFTTEPLTTKAHKMQAGLEEFKALNLKVPALLTINAYLKEIETDISNLTPVKDILHKYSIPVQEQSFTSVWFTATGVKYSEIPRKTKLEANLRKKGYTTQAIKDIMECAE